MKLVDNLTKKEYQDFFNKSKYNHFLQSYEWGQVSKVKKQIPVYFGLYNDKNKLVAVCMALRKDTPLKMCYFYAPRGIIVDYDDFNVLENFTVEMRKYLKSKNAIYFKMDPAIMYQEIDEEANKLSEGKNNYELYNNLIKLGYKHGGFTKLYTKNQPRYTFRINTTRSMEDIETSMNKTFLKTIKRSFNYDLEITREYDNERFFELMKEIAEKDNFKGYPKEYYQQLDEYFSKEKSINYVTIRINPDKELKKAEEELKALKKDIEDNKIPQKKMADAQNQIARYEKDIEVFSPYKGKYKEGYIALILICPKTNHAMWTFYIGNDELATYTFSVNRSYYEAIKMAVEEKKDFLDLFGVTGDPHTDIGNYKGIYEYKRKMGGTYTEFIGEFDLINKPFWNIFLPILLKIYRKLKK